MTRFLNGVAFAALLSSAFFSSNAHAQIQADWEREISNEIAAMEADNDNVIVLYHSPALYKSNDIIIVGTRIGAGNADTLTAPASILNATELRLKNMPHAADYLRALPGVSVSNSGPSANLTQIRLRGSEASHTLVLIDGVKASNPAGGEFDFGGLRAADIERIEVLRGEQSALYGSDAIGGVINIITKTGGQREGLSFSVEAGSFNTQSGHISAGVPIGDSGAVLTLNGNIARTDGYDISGLGGEKDGHNSEGLNLGLNGLELGPVTLSAKYGSSHIAADFDSDTDYNGRLNNTHDSQITDSKTARIDARFDGFGFDHLITASQNEIETDARAAFASRSIGGRTGFSWAAKKSWDSHSLTLLAETEEERYERAPNFAASPAIPKHKTDGLALDYRYSKDALTLNASARNDFNTHFDNAVTWRVGGAYQLGEGHMRASLGTGVKNPSLIELYGYFPGSNFVGNPELTPETSLGYNIGYTHNFDSAKLSVDYFKSELTDEIYTDFASFPYLPKNRASDSTREGVELEGRWTPMDTLSLHGSATFLNAEENGVKELRRPETLASVSGTWEAMDEVSLTLSADYTGEQIDTDFGTFSRVTLGDFTRVSLNASYYISDVVTMTLRGENLLDSAYQEVVGYQAQARGVYFGLSANY
ncbi:MAG: TonB-dependent receptor [Robiginitomaculum sp.]